jgi:putative oxidoreductase
MGWIVGLVEFFGGLGMLVGAFTPLTAGINALNVVGLLVLGAMRGSIPDPLPGGDPLPDFREAFLILAGTLTLVLGGAGTWSVDAFLTREKSVQPRLS